MKISILNFVLNLYDIILTKFLLSVNVCFLIHVYAKSSKLIQGIIEILDKLLLYI